MKVSKPKVITLIISVLLVVIGLVAQFALGGTLFLTAFVWVVVGYIVLLLGNLLNGL